MKHLFFVLALVAVSIASCKKDNKQTLAVVTTSSATNITSNSVQVGGMITGNGGTPVTKSGVCWALTNSPSLSDTFTVSGVATGSFTSNLSGLMSNTTYYYRAYAINGLGTAYGSINSFTTGQGVPSVSTTAITNNAALSALSGDSIVNNGGTAVVVHGVCWSTSTGPTTSNFKTVDSVGGSGSFSDTLTNLTLGVTYYVRAYATNSYGTGYGNQISFTVSSTGTVTDIDGNVYATITIGTQTWMLSNLRVRHYRNGDPIVDGFTGFDLDNNDSTGAYTFPNGDTTTAATYGVYYNTAAVFDSRDIAPVGWHVATDNDWYTLEFYEGLTAADTAMNPGDEGLRGTIGGKLLVGGSSGLNLQLAGFYCTQCGGYMNFGQNGYGVYCADVTYTFLPYNYFRGFNVGAPGQIYRLESTFTASVRCVKD